MARNRDSFGSCAACSREMPLTFHHLIPRSQHRRKWCQRLYTREQMNTGVDVCQDCHSAFHRFVTEKDLAKEYYTLELLLAHEQVGRFVGWVKGQRGRHRTARPRS